MNCDEANRSKPNSEFFKRLYKSFAETDQDILEWYIELGKSGLCWSSLCGVWEQAVYLFVAHHLTVDADANEDPNSPNISRIQKHKADDVETTFFKKPSATTLASGKSGLSETVFGRRLLELIKKNGGLSILNTQSISTGVLVHGTKRILPERF